MLKYQIKSFIYNLSASLLTRLGIGFKSKDLTIIYHPKQANFQRHFDNYCADIMRYINYSTADDSNQNLANMLYRITAHYHVIEKGLTMPTPRPGFGKDIVSSLINYLKVYTTQNYPTEVQEVQTAIKVLLAYRDFNTTHNSMDIDLEKAISSLVDLIVNSHFQGGSKKVLKAEYIKSCKGDFNQLASNRVSIRNFDSAQPTVSTIKSALELAKRTPSVCNRQSWSISFVRQKEKISKILSLQNGNRGFGANIPSLIIVKADLRAFLGAEERNQIFIDSGMFGMSLVYALQYQELGTVVLNWAVNKETDEQLKAELNISESEVVSMIIGVGYLKDELNVPYSQRKETDQLISVIS